MSVFLFRTKWLSNPWIRGGYSHISTECDRSGYGIRKLSEPVVVDDVPRILLAGEAVHPSHYSTTHGAFESGQQQATIVHEFISMESWILTCLEFAILYIPVKIHTNIIQQILHLYNKICSLFCVFELNKYRIWHGITIVWFSHYRQTENQFALIFYNVSISGYWLLFYVV